MENNIIDKRNWRTGYFIKSAKTAHWPQRQIDLTNEDENRIVFANFTEEDKGRSRKRICICENKEDAAFIVKACNEYDSLVSVNSELTRYVEELTTSSFEGWSEDAIKGYKTAIISVNEKLKQLKNVNH